MAVSVDSNDLPRRHALRPRRLLVTHDHLLDLVDLVARLRSLGHFAIRPGVLALVVFFALCGYYSIFFERFVALGSDFDLGLDLKSSKYSTLSLALLLLALGVVGRSAADMKI